MNYTLVIYSEFENLPKLFLLSDLEFEKLLGQYSEDIVESVYGKIVNSDNLTDEQIEIITEKLTDPSYLTNESLVDTLSVNINQVIQIGFAL